MIFDLVRDLADALFALPPTHARRPVLAALQETLERNLAFLGECPGCLGQTLVNSLDVTATRDEPRLRNRLEALRAGCCGYRDSLLSIRSTRGVATDLRRQLNTPHSSITALAVFPTESEFVTGGGDGNVCLWDRGSQTLKWRLAMHNAAVNAIAVHPVAEFIASASADGSVRVAYPLSNSSRPIATRDTPCQSVAISPDGRWLAAGWYDGSIRLWKTDALDHFLEVEGPEFCVRCLAFSTDSKFLAAGSDDLELFVWNVSSAPPPSLQNRFRAHELQINDILFIDDDRLLASASSDKTVRLWRWQSGVSLHVLKGRDSAVAALAAKDDGQEIAAGSFDDTIALWRRPYTEPPRLLIGHGHTVTGLRYLSEGTLLSVSKDTTIREWRPVFPNQTAVPRGRQSPPRRVRVFPDGRTTLAGHADGSVTTWDSAAATCVEIRKLSDAPIIKLAIAPCGGGFAAASADGEIWLLTPNLDVTFHLPATETRGLLESVALSSGIRILAVAYKRPADSYSTIVLWRPPDTTPVGTVHHTHTGDHVVVAINDAGDRVAVGAYGRVTIYDAPGGTKADEFASFIGEVVDLAFGGAPSSLAIATKYATRVGTVGDPSSWNIRARGGPVRAIARPDLYPFWLSLGSNNSLLRSTADNEPRGALPGVSEAFDLTAGESPILVRIENKELTFYKWSS